MTASDAAPCRADEPGHDAALEDTVDVSIIVACYREEATVRALYEQLHSALQSQSRAYEVIFVNDGSTDGTLDALLSIGREDARVVVIDLAKNYGQWQAMTAGICAARGKAIAFLDCDLQLDPEDLPALLDRFDEGYDLVGGRRVNREDSALRKAISRAGNFLLSDLTKGELEDIGCSMKVFRGDLMRAFEFGPMTPFRPLQVVGCAERVAELPIRHHARPHGESKWPVGALVSTFGFALMDLLQGRMRRAGVVALVAGIFALFIAGVARLVSMGGAAMWASMASVVLIQLGLVLIVIDLLILTLVARRVKPAYLVRTIYRSPASYGDTP